MALTTWNDVQRTFTIGNKAENGSGINTVKLTGTTIGWGTSYQTSTTISGTTATSITVTYTTDNTKNSTGTLFLQTGSATATGKISAAVTWKNGGTTDGHEMTQITVNNAVKTVSLSNSYSTAATAQWTDTYVLPTISHTTYNTSTAYHVPTFGAYGEENSIVDGTVIDSSSAYAGSVGSDGKVTCKTTAVFSTVGQAETVVSQAYWPNDKISTLEHKATTTIYFKNAVSNIYLGTSTSVAELSAETSKTIYVEQGKYSEVTYTVIPTCLGVPYSYAVTTPTLAATTGTLSTTTAVAENTIGKIKFTAASNATLNTEYALTISSSNATSAVDSKQTITFHIVAPSKSITLNCGDTYQITNLATGTTITTQGDDTIATGAISGTTLTVTAATGTGFDTTAAETSITLSTGQVITVKVQHITVSLS